MFKRKKDGPTRPFTHTPGCAIVRAEPGAPDRPEARRAANERPPHRGPFVRTAPVREDET